MVSENPLIQITLLCFVPKGDVFHMKALNRHILVLNTLEMTNEFFEKRWAKYSDRPRLPMVIDL